MPDSLERNKHGIPKVNHNRTERKHTHGHIFEQKVIQELQKVSNLLLGDKSFRISTEVEDKFHGTDCYICSCPVDITTSFAGKKYMIQSGIRLAFGTCEVSYGVRCRTKKFPFKHPVLVIGFATNTDVYIDTNNMEEVLTSVGSHWGAILHVGLSWYHRVKDIEEVKQMTLHGKLNINDSTMNPLLIRHEQVSCIMPDMLPIYRVTERSTNLTMQLSEVQIREYGVEFGEAYTLLELTEKHRTHLDEDRFWIDLGRLVFEFHIYKNKCIWEQPPNSINPQIDNFVEALVEHLFTQQCWKIPQWIDEDNRSSGKVATILSPYFPGGEKGPTQLKVMASTPDAFSKRGIYTDLSFFEYNVLEKLFKK